MLKSRLHTGIYTAAGWTAVHALLECARRQLNDNIINFLDGIDVRFDSSMEVVIDFSDAYYMNLEKHLEPGAGSLLKKFGTLLARHASSDVMHEDRHKLQSSDRGCILIGPMSTYTVSAKHIALACDILRGDVLQWDSSIVSQFSGEPLNPVDYGIIDAAVSELSAAAKSFLELPFHSPEDIASFAKHKSSLFSLMKKCMDKNSAGCEISDEMICKSFIGEDLRGALEYIAWCF